MNTSGWAYTSLRVPQDEPVLVYEHHKTNLRQFTNTTRVDEPALIYEHHNTNMRQFTNTTRRTCISLKTPQDEPTPVYEHHKTNLR